MLVQCSISLPLKEELLLFTSLSFSLVGNQSFPISTLIVRTRPHHTFSLLLSYSPSERVELQLFLSFFLFPNVFMTLFIGVTQKSDPVLIDRQMERDKRGTHTDWQRKLMNCHSILPLNQISDFNLVKILYLLRVWRSLPSWCWFFICFPFSPSTRQGTTSVSENLFKFWKPDNLLFLESV